MKIDWPWIAKTRRAKNDPTAKTTDDVGTERPIKGASEDLLRRAHFAGRIAEIVSTPNVREGRVFAIRSAWGNGKSSLKNLVIEKLAERPGHAQWLEFNAWQWGDGDAIARALFSQMAGKLGGHFSPQAERRARALRRYGALLVGAAGPLRNAGDATTGLASWGPILALAIAGFGIQLPDLPVTDIISWALIASAVLMGLGKLFHMSGRDRSDEPLSGVREELERRLMKLRGPLIVFVDDMDRLEPEQIRLVVRQVKVNANLPNIVFILLFQPSIIVKALDPVADGAGGDYLEKIVQANFDLPAAPREAIHRIFTQQLAAIVDELATPENGFGAVRWGNTLIGGMQPFIGNLRDVRRLLSSIAIHAPLHQGGKVFEVNLIDFLALEALRVFQPNLHAAIANHKALLLQSARFDQDGASARDKEALEAILEHVPSERRQAATNLVKELFPTVAWAFGGSHYGGEWVKGWIAEKRVCTERMFDRYFELQIPEGTLSDSDFAMFLESCQNAQQLAAALERLATDGLLPSLASRLDESVERLPLEHIRVLLPALFNLGRELKAVSDDPFNSPYVATWRAAVWFLRRVDSPQERGRIMADAMNASDALAVPALLISLDVDAREKVEPTREYLFDDAGLDALKAIWSAKVTALAEDGERLLSTPDLASVLYRWRDFGGEAGPKAWVARVAAMPHRLPELLSRFLSVGRTHAMTDYVATRTEHYQRESIEGFFDLPTLEQAIAALDRSALSPDHGRAISMLEQNIADWLANPAKGGVDHEPPRSNDT